MRGGSQTRGDETTRRRRGLREEHGVALVEFTLVAPLLMLLLFAMVDFGRAFNYWIDETHLANTGARMAVVDRWPTKDSGQTLHEFLVSQADTGELQASVAVCIWFPDPDAVTDPDDPDAPPPPDGGDPFQFKPDPGVGDPFTVLLWMKEPFKFIPLVGPWEKEIAARSTMRLEKSAPYSYANADDNDCPTPSGP